MTNSLRWEDGQHRHIGDLQQFQCTEYKPPQRLRDWPPPDSTGPWWEWEVQQQIKAMRPPFRGGRHMLLGYDLDDGLATVSVFQELDGWAYVNLEYSAVALRYRRTGSTAVADAMFVATLDTITTNAVDAGLKEVRLVGYVYDLNGPSQKLCGRHNLVPGEPAGEGVTHWYRDLPVAT